MIDHSKIWWETITNPSRFVADISEALLDGNSVLLSGTDIMPWTENFTGILQNRIREDLTREVRRINCNEGSPEEILLALCSPEVRNGYRPNISCGEFLANHDNVPLHEFVVWIYDVPEEDIDVWGKLIKDYSLKRGRNHTSCVFIIESNDAKSSKSYTKLKSFSYSKYVGTFDSYIFCMLLTSTMSDKYVIRPYLARLAANICGDDIELASNMLESENYKSFLDNPYETVMRVSAEMQLEEKTEWGEREELCNKQIIKTQMEMVFPMLEQFRNQIIEKYRKQIEKLLPLENHNGDDYQTAEEVEIGPLSYLAQGGDIKVSVKELTDMNEARELRNKIAHVKVIEYSRIQALFS